MNMTISDILKSYRRKHHLSQTELGNKIGISQISVSKIETGKTFPHERTLKQIANAIGWDYQTLRKVIKGE